MNLNITRRFVFGLALALGCTVAFVPAAQAKGEGEKARHGKVGGKRGKGFMKMNPQAFIQKFDANGDGILEVRELPKKLQQRLASADTNRDGRLSVEELEAHRATRMAERGKKHFAKLDKNGDGVLTKDEVGEKKWKRIGKADANGDGKVTQEELEQARKAFRGGKKGKKGPRNSS